MARLYLVLAIPAEVAGTTSMKPAEGFTRFVPSVFVVLFYGLSIVLPTLALRTTDVSVAYAVRSGEPATAVRLVSLGLIAAGVSGLDLGDAHRAPDRGLREELPDRQAPPGHHVRAVDLTVPDERRDFGGRTVHPHRPVGRVHHDDHPGAGTQPFRHLALDLGVGVSGGDYLDRQVRRPGPETRGVSHLFDPFATDESHVGGANGVGVPGKYETRLRRVHGPEAILLDVPGQPPGDSDRDPTVRVACRRHRA